MSITGTSHIMPIMDTSFDHFQQESYDKVYQNYNQGITYNETSYCCTGGDNLTLNEKKIKNLNKLQRISKLEFDWNENKAEPFHKALITCVENLILNIEPQPSLFPTAVGAIQIEYEKENGDYLEFEIYNEHKITLFSIINGVENTRSLIDVKQIQEEVTVFYGKSNRS